MRAMSFFWCRLTIIDEGGSARAGTGHVMKASSSMAAATAAEWGLRERGEGRERHATREPRRTVQHAGTREREWRAAGDPPPVVCAIAVLVGWIFCARSNFYSAS